MPLLSPSIVRGLLHIRGRPTMRIPVVWLRRFHAVATIAWLLLAVPSVLWWKHSILWVIILSVWANFASHFAAWQSTRAEDAAEHEDT
jgi:hypothetical protein